VTGTERNIRRYEEKSQKLFFQEEYVWRYNHRNESEKARLNELSSYWKKKLSGLIVTILKRKRPFQKKPIIMNSCHHLAEILREISAINQQKSKTMIVIVPPWEE